MAQAGGAVKALLIALALLATACQPTRLEQCETAVDELYKALCEDNLKDIGTWNKPCSPGSAMRAAKVMECMSGFGLGV